MIFIRPTILRDAATTAIETNQKYNMIRDIQQRNDTGVQLMPNESRPVLPPIEEYSRDSAGDDNAAGDEE
jgi:type II secretory pathway component GspD/PulD (secretin)